ncbi:MAG: BolA/IbaG family iron-sulfur metabolism protein [Pseudomonadales bacterium]|nr:BolA/IbaG family iron-sulfur metabolism protein [Pseudomonadales bacterium]
MGPVQQRIEEKLAAALSLAHLEVRNESSNHNVPPDSESHFKVVLVSEAFASLKLLARHRLVNAALADELQSSIHALAIHAYSLQEWQQRFGNVPLSPPCLGGSRGDGRANLV